MIKKILIALAIFTIAILTQCKKEEFLEKKPNSSLVVPKSLNDLQALLDNTNVMNFTGGLAQLASDDYYVSDANFQAVSVATQRNSYIWAKDIYAGELAIRDWNDLYKQIFYTNAVLDELKRSYPNPNSQANYLKGWALFARAYAFYDLIRNFCKAYDPLTADTDLGIPLRLSANIDYLAPRASLQQSINQILADLNECESLLPSERPATNLNRPSKIALYAFLARINLDMRNYSQAQHYANLSLSLYSTLIDYKTVSKTATIPFTTVNDELIYYSTSVVSYAEFLSSSNIFFGRVRPDVLQLYSANDLRLSIYFARLADNSYYKKRGYNGSSNYAFTGLATDELYLIKAECLARTGKTQEALDVLNSLLIKRWDASATNPALQFQAVSAISADDALKKILLERRKELIWRALRWQDLKRLNKEGASIVLNRMVAGTNYSLPPNDPRYVFPIPEDEISLSGIEQNIR